MNLKISGKNGKVEKVVEGATVKDVVIETTRIVQDIWDDGLTPVTQTNEGGNLIEILAVDTDETEWDFDDETGEEVVVGMGIVYLVSIEIL